MALVAGACGGSASGRGEPVIQVKAPQVAAGPLEARELESLPTPTPPPPTPPPTPSPTPAPLAPPRGASIQAGTGMQTGVPSSFCWTAQPGVRGECYDNGAQEQAHALAVRPGEVALVSIDADRAPGEQTIRAYRGSRTGYPSQRIAPALETELTIDLEPGEWNLDLCATWHGHGEPICWLFRLLIEAPQTPTPNPEPADEG